MHFFLLTTWILVDIVSCDWRGNNHEGMFLLLLPLCLLQVEEIKESQKLFIDSGDSIVDEKNSKIIVGCPLIRRKAPTLNAGGSNGR